METKKHIPHHRREKRREYHFGPNKQDITCPYCRNALIAQKKILMHIELAPHGGNGNMEIRQQLRREVHIRRNGS